MDDVKLLEIFKDSLISMETIYSYLENGQYIFAERKLRSLKDKTLTFYGALGRKIKNESDNNTRSV